MRSLLLSLALGLGALVVAGALPSNAHAQMRWARQPGTWGTYNGYYSPSYTTYYGNIGPAYYYGAYAAPAYYGYYPGYAPGYYGYTNPSYSYSYSYSYPTYGYGGWR